MVQFLTSIIVIVNICFAVAVVVVYERSVKEGVAEWDASELAMKKALKQSEKVLSPLLSDFCVV